MTRSYKHLFGPVPSRRFGRSLGIDLTPFKICSYDCVFCQLGRTTRLTLARENFVDLDETLSEIEHWLKNDGKADQITLAGSGEPTLHAGFGEVISFVKARTRIPVAVLTNGSMLYLPEVRKAAAQADIVKISLSAWDQESLEKINRPAPGYRFEQLIEGEKQFRNEFSGKLWIEVFMLDGINSTPAEVAKIAAFVRQIRPDRVQLNTCVRPPAEESARAVPEKSLRELATVFEPAAEIIAEYRAADGGEVKVNEQAILEMLQRRPCTADQIAEVFGMHLNEVSKYLGMLTRSDLVTATHRNNDVYYFARKNSGRAACLKE
ncbi:MAG: radical SAM protein [Candidatus Riflebacteria bacterium HGW-Riflebacteria-2]|jgi:wyosine [tRNA(Phe)-imidazoG37] synthetase (radical SAM superfamily)|nr:MAG: radical SAM protein [Candidatus Riflebacteria bacterium HGW-Riflebacteria-2]